MTNVIKVILLPITIPFAIVLGVAAKMGSERAKRLLFYFAEDEDVT